MSVSARCPSGGSTRPTPTSAKASPPRTTSRPNVACISRRGSTCGRTTSRSAAASTGASPPRPPRRSRRWRRRSRRWRPHCPSRRRRPLQVAATPEDRLREAMAARQPKPEAGGAAGAPAPEVTSPAPAVPDTQLVRQKDGTYQSESGWHVSSEGNKGYRITYYEDDFGLHKNLKEARKEVERQQEVLDAARRLLAGEPKPEPAAAIAAAPEVVPPPEAPAPSGAPEAAPPAVEAPKPTTRQITRRWTKRDFHGKHGRSAAGSRRRLDDRAVHEGSQPSGGESGCRGGDRPTRRGDPLAAHPA